MIKPGHFVLVFYMFQSIKIIRFQSDNYCPEIVMKNELCYILESRIWMGDENGKTEEIWVYQ